MIFKSLSKEDTESIGMEFGKKATAGSFYGLVGDLAAGKTAFVRGFARGLGVVDEVSSPTFSIVNEYRGGLPLYHFDVYRLGGSEGMADTGYEEYFYGSGVVLVEWADLIEDLMPENAVIINFEKDMARGENFRWIMVAGG